MMKIEGYNFDRRPWKRGGMAELYIGTRDVDRKRVVLKVLNQEGVSDSSVMRSFNREYRYAESIGRTNDRMAAAYKRGRLPDGRPYFIMRYIEGEDVQSLVTRANRTGKRLSVRLAGHVIGQTAEVLHALHSFPVHPIIHRDVSPDNIIIGDDRERVYLIDFGIATGLPEDGHVSGGKPAYTPPEGHHKPAPSSDIYALGVVLHQMLTGHFPRELKDPAALIANITTIRPDAPKWLADFVARMLAERPATRPTAHEVIEYLRGTQSFPAAPGEIDVIRIGGLEEPGQSPDDGDAFPAALKATLIGLLSLVFVLLLAGGGYGVWWMIRNSGKGPVDIPGQDGGGVPPPVELVIKNVETLTPQANSWGNLLPRRGLWISPTGSKVTSGLMPIISTHSRDGFDLFIDSEEWGVTKEYTVSARNTDGVEIQRTVSMGFPAMPIKGLALSSALSPDDNATMRDPGHRSYSPRLVVSLPLGGDLFNLSGGSSTNSSSGMITEHIITGIKWGQGVSFSYGLPGGNAWRKTIRIPSIDDVRLGRDVNDGEVEVAGLREAKSELTSLHASPGSLDDPLVENWIRTATRLPDWLSVKGRVRPPPPEPEADFPLTEVAVSIPPKPGPPALTIKKHHADETVLIDGKEWATGTTFPLPGKKWGDSVSLRITNKRGATENRNIALNLPPGLKQILDKSKGRIAEDIRASYDPWKNYLSDAFNRQFTDLLRPPTSRLIPVEVTKAGPPKFKLEQVVRGEIVLSEVVMIGGRSLTHRGNRGEEYTLPNSRWGDTVAYAVQNNQGVRSSHELTIPLQGGTVFAHVGIQPGMTADQVRGRRDVWARYLRDEDISKLDKLEQTIGRVSPPPPPEPPEEDFPRTVVAVSTPRAPGPPSLTIKKHHADETVLIDGKEWATGTTFPLPGKKWGDSVSLRITNKRGATENRNIALNLPPGLKQILDKSKGRIAEDIRASYDPWKNYLSDAFNRQFTDLLRPPTSRLIPVAVTKAGPPKVKLKAVVRDEVVAIGGHSLSPSPGTQHTLAANNWGDTVTYTVQNNKGVEFSRELPIPLQGGSVSKHVGITPEMTSTQMKTKGEPWERYFREEDKKELKEKISAKLEIEQKTPAKATLKVWVNPADKKHPYLQLDVEKGNGEKIWLTTHTDEKKEWKSKETKLSVKKWGDIQPYSVANAFGFPFKRKSVTLNPPDDIAALMGIEPESSWIEMAGILGEWHGCLNNKIERTLALDLQNRVKEDLEAKLDLGDGFRTPVNLRKIVDEFIAQVDRHTTSVALRVLLNGQVSNTVVDFLLADGDTRISQMTNGNGQALADVTSEKDDFESIVEGVSGAKGLASIMDNNRIKKALSDFDLLLSEAKKRAEDEDKRRKEQESRLRAIKTANGLVSQATQAYSERSYGTAAREFNSAAAVYEELKDEVQANKNYFNSAMCEVREFYRKGVPPTPKSLAALMVRARTLGHRETEGFAGKLLKDYKDIHPNDWRGECETLFKRLPSGPLK